MRVERLSSADWGAWRALRLEALADTPIGYGELHADALALPDEEWRRRMALPRCHVLAYDGDAPLGMAGGLRDEAGSAVLFGVYVRPGARGKGVLGAMVDAVADWAGPDLLELDVHEANARAHRAYLKLGFVDTGQRGLGRGIDGRDLLRMRRAGRASSVSLQPGTGLG